MTSPNTKSEPASNTISPITTNGNWFSKDGQRVPTDFHLYHQEKALTQQTQFLIKGLTYAPRNHTATPWSPESYIDPLGDAWLPELRKDIPYLRQLGINTIFVDHADISQPPDQALQLLQEAGIYVLLKLFTNISLKGSPSPPEIDLQSLYSPSKVRKNLVLVSQTAKHPNVLGYSISQDVHTPASTKFAALHRAAVRDTKLFLQKSGSRPIPAGASPSANQMYRRDTMRFMAAGEPAERIDFYAFDVYDWCDPSNFKISGYKGLVEALSDDPVPMLFGEYGAHMGKPRDLGEVECLFSPDMTGVFSGGFLTTYGHVEDVYSRPEDGEDGDEDEFVGRYDLVRIRDDGVRRPKRDYATYQRILADIAAKPEQEVCGDHEKKDYESWRGAFGGIGVDRIWLADPQDVPVFPLEWSAVLD